MKQEKSSMPMRYEKPSILTITEKELMEKVETHASCTFSCGTY
jgi:hypothetical protein